MTQTADTQMKPMLAKLEEIELKIRNPLPTPPIGTPVVWYPHARVVKGAEVAALVTGIEGPGRLKITVFVPNGMPVPKQACHHVTDPVHEKRNNSISKTSGAWDYIEGTKTPKADFQFHLEHLNKLKNDFTGKIEQAQAIAAEKTERNNPDPPAT